MDHQERLIKIDACRPGQEDLRAPEMASLAAELESNNDVQDWFQQSQQTDQNIQAALHDIAVPAGMAERLLASLAKAQPPKNQPSENQASENQSTTQCGEMTSAVDASTPQSQSQSQPGPETIVSRESNSIEALNSRRQRVIAIMVGPMIGIAVMLMIAVSFLFSGPDRTLTQADAIDEVFSLYTSDVAPFQEQLTELKEGQHDEHPLSPEIELRHGFVKGWTQASSEEKQYTAYILQGLKGRVRGALFVRKLSGDPSLPTHPNPNSANTGGFWFATWKDPDRGLLYVMVLQGTDRDRQKVNHFLRSSGFNVT